ncbi:MAG TPA: serine hydrolase domain-containing protein [Acidimicrobiales bacterium]
MTTPLAQVSEWAPLAAAGVVRRGMDQGPAVVASHGDTRRTFPWASVTKILTAMSLWIATEEGTVGWDDPVGPPGATLADLVSHASGLAPDDDRRLAPPRTRRIYSNRGIELAAAHLAERSGMSFPEYMTTGLLDPLGLDGVRLDGSPAHGASGSLADLLAIGAELLEPTVVSRSTLIECTQVATPGLSGVLPGFGPQQHNDWGLGVEIRDHKEPHWTGHRNSPSTFGHFGQSGCFLWVDPRLGLALALLTGRGFGPWAEQGWSEFSDDVIAEYRTPDYTTDGFEPPG